MRLIACAFVTFSLLFGSVLLGTTAVQADPACIVTGPGVYVYNPITGLPQLVPAQCGPSGLLNAGDLLYGASNGKLTSLGIGTTGQCLVVASGLPSWASCGGGGGPTLAADQTWTGNNIFNQPLTVSATSTVGLLNMGNGGAILKVGAAFPPGGPCVAGSMVSGAYSLSSCYQTVWEIHPPTVYADGTEVAATFHCVSSPAADFTAAGTTSTITFSGLAVFSGGYTLVLQDDTAVATAAPTSKAPTNFVFTSVVGHVYAYRACGE